MKLVRLIKLSLNETYSTVREGKHFSYMFPTKNYKKKKKKKKWFSNLLESMQLGGFRSTRMACN
jgi:hypothetical protein